MNKRKVIVNEEDLEAIIQNTPEPSANYAYARERLLKPTPVNENTLMAELKEITDVKNRLAALMAKVMTDPIIGLRSDGTYSLRVLDIKVDQEEATLLNEIWEEYNG